MANDVVQDDLDSDELVSVDGHVDCRTVEELLTIVSLHHFVFVKQWIAGVEKVSVARESKLRAFLIWMVAFIATLSKKRFHASAIKS